MWLDIYTWFVTLSIFYTWTARRKRSIFKWCSCAREFGIIGTYFWMVLVFHYECFHSDRFLLPYGIGEEDVGAVIFWRYCWQPLYFEGWLNDLWCFPQYSLVVLVHCCERQLRYGLSSGDRCVWCYINIQELLCNNIIVGKICNALKTIYLTYYWPECGTKISLPIVENL